MADRETGTVKVNSNTYSSPLFTTPNPAAEMEREGVWLHRARFNGRQVLITHSDQPPTHCTVSSFAS